MKSRTCARSTTWIFEHHRKRKSSAVNMVKTYGQNITKLASSLSHKSMTCARFEIYCRFVPILLLVSRYRNTAHAHWAGERRRMSLEDLSPSPSDKIRRAAAKARKKSPRWRMVSRRWETEFWTRLAWIPVFCSYVHTATRCTCFVLGWHLLFSRCFCDRYRQLIRTHNSYFPCFQGVRLFLLKTFFL